MVQPNYPPQQVTNVVADVNPNQVWGISPQACKCQFCEREVVSTIIYKTGSSAFIISGVLCIIGCWPCCLYPFCIDSLKEKYHACPECNKIIGAHGNSKTN